MGRFTGDGGVKAGAFFIFLKSLVMMCGVFEERGLQRTLLEASVELLSKRNCIEKGVQP